MAFVRFEVPAAAPVQAGFAGSFFAATMHSAKEGRQDRKKDAAGGTTIERCTGEAASLDTISTQA